MARKRYAIIIEKGERNRSAYCPDLPGAVAAGETTEEAAELMKEAIELHLEGLKEDDPPHTRADHHRDMRRKFCLIRLPPSWKRWRGSRWRSPSPTRPSGPEARSRGAGPEDPDGRGGQALRDGEAIVGCRRQARWHPPHTFPVEARRLRHRRLRSDRRRAEQRGPTRLEPSKRFLPLRE